VQKVSLASSSYSLSLQNLVQDDRISNTYSIQIAGRGREVRFTNPANAPATGANVLNLMKDSRRDIMIHCRVDKDQLLISSCRDGTWLGGGRVTIPSPGLGAPGKVVRLQVQAQSDHFFVTINDDGGHKYPYQLPYSDVTMGAVGSGLEYYTVYPNL